MNTGRRLRGFLVLLAAVAISTAAAAKTNIAVLDLDMSSGVSESYRSVLSDRLRLELFKTGSFTVVERSTMEDILAEQSLQLSGCTSTECAVEVGKVLGVTEMVAGSVGQVGSVYTVNVRLIDVETGAVIAAESVDCTCPIDVVLTSSLHEAAQKLARAMEPADTAAPMPAEATYASALPVEKDTSYQRSRAIQVPHSPEVESVFGWMRHTGITAFGLRGGWSFVPGSSNGWVGGMGNGLFVEFRRLGTYHLQMLLGGGGVTSLQTGLTRSVSDGSIQFKLYRFLPDPDASSGLYSGVGMGLHTITRTDADITHHTTLDWQGTYGHLGVEVFAGDLFDLHWNLWGQELYTFAEVNYLWLFTSRDQPNGFLSGMTGIGMKLETFGR